MSFSPESNNPRERRSYAGAKLVEYRAGQTSYGETADAVLDALHTRKGRIAGLAETLGKSAVLYVSWQIGTPDYTTVGGYAMSTDEAAMWANARTYRRGGYGQEYVDLGLEAYSFRVLGEENAARALRLPLDLPINPAIINGAVSISK